jgi:NAD(P)-dependent dehydrogenase (short-subunit alcohol dehydrogenase family)
MSERIAKLRKRKSRVVSIHDFVRYHEAGPNFGIPVNNAAFQEYAGHITDISDEQFDRTLKTNLRHLKDNTNPGHWHAATSSTSLQRA